LILVTRRDIRALLALAAPGRRSWAEIRDVASAHLADVRAKLADLAKLESILASTIARCSGTASPACPVLDILSAEYLPRGRRASGSKSACLCLDPATEAPIALANRSERTQLWYRSATWCP